MCVSVAIIFFFDHVHTRVHINASINASRSFDLLQFGAGTFIPVIYFLFFIFISVSVFQLVRAFFFGLVFRDKISSKTIKIFFGAIFQNSFHILVVFLFCLDNFFFLFVCYREIHKLLCWDCPDTWYASFFLFFCWVICFEPKAHTTIED